MLKLSRILFLLFKCLIGRRLCTLDPSVTSIPAIRRVSFFIEFDCYVSVLAFRGVFQRTLTSTDLNVVMYAFPLHMRAYTTRCTTRCTTRSPCLATPYKAWGEPILQSCWWWHRNLPGRGQHFYYTCSHLCLLDVGLWEKMHAGLKWNVLFCNHANCYKFATIFRNLCYNEHKITLERVNNIYYMTFFTRD